MSERGREFITGWAEENLAPEPTSDRLHDFDTLTSRCLAAAEALGIGQDEIEEEIGDLRSFIKEALEDKSDEEGEGARTVLP